MSRRLILSMATALAGLCAVNAASQAPTGRVAQPVGFENVTIEDAFWTPRLERHRTATVPVCIDQIEKKTGRMLNFDRAARGAGSHSGIFFDDSDVYKAIEGMAYALQNERDPALEATADQWIDKICAAQQPDGYLNTYYTLKGLDKRFTDSYMHEMYCAGHMIEAAIAYKHATGKDKFLKTAERLAQYLEGYFGPGKRPWVPGHEEIELALVKLYDETGDSAHLDFAHWLLEQRGRALPMKEDDQSLVPVSEMHSIYGHAVRAMYLFCAMADVAALNGDKAYLTALDSLWNDVVGRNMYITGGIGSSGDNEGFTHDYDLPNKEAYCETCASVGMVLWNWRMNLMTGDSKYADVMERALYNGVLAGINLAGDHFFYVNPLEADGTHHRKEWYGCACCPSQICRFLPSIGNYVYAVNPRDLYVNLYIAGQGAIPADGDTLYVSQTGNYPWDGTVTLTLDGSLGGRDIKLRIPAWANTYDVTLNGKRLKTRRDKGYAVVDGKRLKKGDKITLTLPMEARLTAADPRVEADRGRRAIERGPMVFCLEEADNAGKMDAVIDTKAPLASSFQPSLLEGVQVVDAMSTDAQPLRFIPYYSWDNRTPGRMAVWIPAK